MALCPFGKASVCFPLSIGRAAALATLDSKETVVQFRAKVVGHTTRKTLEAGAASVRMQSVEDVQVPEPGAYLVMIRAGDHTGFLPGLAAPRCGGTDDSFPANDFSLEIVLLGRADPGYKAVMYLPEPTLQQLLPSGTTAEVCIRRFLMPVQHDCPGQWLRDRLLRLADQVDEAFAPVVDIARDSSHELRNALERSGLKHSTEAVDRNLESTGIALPADHGQRTDEVELGYWGEEMRHNTVCGASMDGERRLDAPEVLPSFPGIESML